ncbi:MAG: dockerin type I repeat-containing protein, partial [Oscillospiraceae bacterium]|nr:dockerin type I repeat-containing protein [Oscillospiraceae bacterium]
MVNLKKYFKAAVSSALALSMALAAVPITASASDTITFLEGDVNDDGYVTVSDVALISKYLNGKSGASSEEITRMDAVQNKVIEMQDYNKILWFVYKGNDPTTPEKPDPPKTVTSEVYTNIDDSSRAYFVYDFESDTQIGSYALAANTISTASTYARTFETYDDYRDNENFYSVNMEKHKQLGENTVFAGGIWGWSCFSILFS